MTRYQPMVLCHYGMAQRWLVVSSQAAIERAEESVNKAQERELEAIEKQLFHLQAKRFETPEAAQAALAALRTSWRYHQVATTDLIEHKRYAGKGRPTPSSPVKAMAWQMQAQVRVDAALLEGDKQHRACFVIGTNIEASQLSDVEVIRAYKAQAMPRADSDFSKTLCFLSRRCLSKNPVGFKGC